MTKNISIEMINDKILKKLKRSKYNRYFQYHIETDDEILNLRLLGNRELTVSFQGCEVTFYMLFVTIHLLFNEDNSEWTRFELAEMVAYEDKYENMPEDKFWELIFNILLMFAGSTKAVAVRGDRHTEAASDNCLCLSCYDVYEHDIYIESLLPEGYDKKCGNIAFHINGEFDIDDEIEKNIVDVKLDPAKMMLWNYWYWDMVCSKYLDWHKIPGETRYFYKRNILQNRKKKIRYYNDEQGDFFIIDNSSAIAVHCRDMMLSFIYDFSDELKNVVEVDISIYNGNIDGTKPFDYYVMLGEVKLLLTGAGDISHEEVTNPDGSKSYSIFIEKEYDTSYTKQFGNMTFYMNNGYKHKTEQERLEDFFASTEVRLENMSDIVRNILHPLQTTKASRFLCYKLIEDETTTLCFNGKDGDFYLKAKGEELMFHCRDMAICFTDNAKDMAEEDDDIWQYKSQDEDESLKSVFAVAYEMIFILAGAGEVTHEAIDGGARYRISLEKEYVDDYTKTIGNVVFDVRREVYEKGL